MSYNTTATKEEFKKIEEWLAKEYGGIHSGRATPALLDSIMVEAYGSAQPIRNIASINGEDSRTLRIAPWDKSQIKDIEKALHAANLGLSVVSDSDGVRAIVPVLTTENRQKLVKIVKEKLEDARISVRKAREEALGELKNEKLPEDDERRAKEEIQKLVDAANSALEVLFNKKESEIMTQ